MFRIAAVIAMIIDKFQLTHSVNCILSQLEHLQKSVNKHMRLIKLITLSWPWAGLGRRSASMSYLSILKHSSRSSKKSAYVRTQAEQSQAVEKAVVHHYYSPFFSNNLFTDLLR